MTSSSDEDSASSDLNLSEQVLQDKDLFGSLYGSTYSISDDDIVKSLTEFDPSLYASESKKLQSLIQTKLASLRTLRDVYEEEHGKQVSLHETCELFEYKFENCSDIHTKLSIMLNDSKTKVQEIKKTITQIQKELFIMHKHTPHYTHNDPRKICAICTQNEVDTAIYPCGHTLCNQCAFTLPTQHCFFCRNEIQNIIKIYFS